MPKGKLRVAAVWVDCPNCADPEGGAPAPGGSLMWKVWEVEAAEGREVGCVACGRRITVPALGKLVKV